MLFSPNPTTMLPELLLPSSSQDRCLFWVLLPSLPQTEGQRQKLKTLARPDTDCSPGWLPNTVPHHFFPLCFNYLGFCCLAEMTSEKVPRQCVAFSCLPLSLSGEPFYWSAIVLSPSPWEHLRTDSPLHMPCRLPENCRASCPSPGISQEQFKF